jgi:hypothetical protein
MDIALRLARQFEARAIPETLALVREHVGRMTKVMTMPHEQSAVVYEFFVRDEPDPTLRRLAQRCLARCLANAGGERLQAGEYKVAASLLWSALTEAGPTSDWVTAIARGLRNRGKRAHHGE